MTPRPGTDMTLREAAIVVDEKLARWVGYHYTMEYPFHEAWKGLHRALYGHDPKPVLSPCQRCVEAKS